MPDYEYNFNEEEDDHSEDRIHEAMVISTEDLKPHLQMFRWPATHITHLDRDTEKIYLLVCGTYTTVEVPRETVINVSPELDEEIQRILHVQYRHYIRRIRLPEACYPPFFESLSRGKYTGSYDEISGPALARHAILFTEFRKWNFKDDEFANEAARCLFHVLVRLCKGRGTGSWIGAVLKQSPIEWTTDHPLWKELKRMYRACPEKKQSAFKYVLLMVIEKIEAGPPPTNSEPFIDEIKSLGGW